MNLNFVIDKSFIIPHKILEYLYNDFKNNNNDEQLIGSIKIAEKTKIAIAEIHRYQHILVNKGEIVILNNDGQSMMSIQQSGLTSYVEKRYLREGRKLFFDNIFDWARIIIPLGALILSIVNYINNNSLAEKIVNIEAKIKTLKK